MTTIRQRVVVNYEFPVHFTHDLFSLQNPLLARTLLADTDKTLGAADPKRVLVVLDEGFVQHHPKVPEQITAYFDQYSALTSVAVPLITTGGEETKNTPKNVTEIQQAVEQYGIDRHSYIVAVGGGALLDMAGYAAATAHRGVRLVRSTDDRFVPKRFGRRRQKRRQRLRQKELSRNVCAALRGPQRPQLFRDASAARLGRWSL